MSGRPPIGGKRTGTVVREEAFAREEFLFRGCRPLQYNSRVAFRFGQGVRRRGVVENAYGQGSYNSRNAGSAPPAQRQRRIRSAVYRRPAPAGGSDEIPGSARPGE